MIDPDGRKLAGEAERGFHPLCRREAALPGLGVFDREQRLQPGAVPFEDSPVPHRFLVLLQVHVQGPAPLENLPLHPKDDRNRDIGLGTLHVPGADLFAAGVVKMTETENDRDAGPLVDDIVEIAELGVAHLGARVIRGRDPVPGGTGPHAHDAEIAVAVGEDGRLRVENRHAAVEKIEPGGAGDAAVRLQQLDHVGLVDEPHPEPRGLRPQRPHHVQVHGGQRPSGRQAVEVQFPGGSLHDLDPPLGQLLHPPPGFRRHRAEQFLVVEEDPDLVHMVVDEGVEIVFGTEDPQHPGALVRLPPPADRLLVHERHARVGSHLLDPDGGGQPAKTAADHEDIRAPGRLRAPCFFRHAPLLCEPPPGVSTVGPALPACAAGS